MPRQRKYNANLVIGENRIVSDPDRAVDPLLTLSFAFLRWLPGHLRVDVVSD
jgi:hypothetical protein